MSILLQSIMAPILASAVTLVVGRSMREKTGWVAFLASLYSTLLLSTAFLKVYSGEVMVERYTSSHLIGAFTLVADGLNASIALTSDTVDCDSSILHRLHEG